MTETNVADSDPLHTDRAYQGNSESLAHNLATAKGRVLHLVVQSVVFYIFILHTLIGVRTNGSASP